MAVSLSPTIVTLKTEAKQYHMTKEIAKLNIALLKSAKKGEKFKTDTDTGKLTLETNKGVFNTVSRSISKVFKPSAVVATFQFILDKAPELREDFDAALRAGEGLHQLTETYKANMVFRSIFRELTAVIECYIVFAKPKTEPPPIVKILNEAARLDAIVPAPPPKKLFAELSSEELEKKLEVQRGKFGKLLSDFKHKSEKDLKSVLKSANERPLKPAPLNRSVSCTHVEILKSSNFQAMISKARECMEVKPCALSDDVDEWDDGEKKNTGVLLVLDPDLLKRLERLNKRCIQKKESNVKFG